MDVERGSFRVRGDVLEIYPAQGGDYLIRVEYFGDEIDRITEVDPLTGKVHAALNHIAIFPASHYVVSPVPYDLSVLNSSRFLNKNLFP